MQKLSRTSHRLAILIALVSNAALWPRGPAFAGDEKQAAIVAAIEKVGGKAERDHLLGKYYVSFWGSGLGDAGLIIIKDLEDIRSLDLRGTRVTDAGLAQLEGRKKLLVLELGTEITDAGLIHIESIPDLRSLDLRETQVSDAGLLHLKKLTRLRYLDLRGTRLTRSGIAALRAALPRVEIRGSDEIPYFPEGVFDKNDKDKDESEAQELIRYLRPMGEPPLWKRDKDDREADVFRLLWVPSFHHPIAVRIIKSGGSVALHAEELDGTPTTRLGKVGVKKQRKLTEAEWTRLQVYVEQARFWKMPTIRVPPPDEGFTLDGDELICEGVADGKYHIVYRSNVPDPDYNDLCRFLLDLSGLDVEKTWKEYHVEKGP